MVVPICNCSAGEEGMGKYLGLATLTRSSPVRNTIKAVLLPLYVCICTYASPPICLRVHVHTHTVKILFKYSLSVLMWKMSDFWISMVCVYLWVWASTCLYMCSCAHVSMQILKYWGYKHTLPCLALHGCWASKLRFACLYSKHFTSWSTPQSQYVFVRLALWIKWFSRYFHWNLLKWGTNNIIKKRWWGLERQLNS